MGAAGRTDHWIPGPVRPEPPGGPTPGDLPVWAGAAQRLESVIPRRGGAGPASAYTEAVVAARAAAAGPVAGRRSGHMGPLTPADGSDQRAGRPSFDRRVPVAVSNRHIHLGRADTERLFGPGHDLTVDRPIRQPGQFAAVERLRVVGPRGTIDGVRVVGPNRDATQVELAVSDCAVLGIEAPVRASGSQAGSAPVRLEGPAGAVDLADGAIVPARHLHLSEQDAARFGVRDGDRVTLEVGEGDRHAVLPGVLVRAGATHATELHLDVDEARAVGVGRSGGTALLRGRPQRGRPEPSGRRRLIAERDVADLAATGRTLTDGAGVIVTPAARDRAKALGIWRERR